jgi:hypothetical protein
MYPFKRAIEQLRVASVQWSPSREAAERTRVVNVRVGEVESLINLRMFNQLPNALGALDQAVRAAQVAVKEAASQGEPVPGVAAKLSQLEVAGSRVVLRVAAAAANGSVELSEGTRRAIEAAVEDSQKLLPPPDRTPESTPSGGPPVTTPQPKEEHPVGSTPEPDPTEGTTPSEQSSSTTQTTESTTTTTTAPEPESSTTTEPEATPGSVEGAQPTSPGGAPYEVGDTTPTTVQGP